MPQIPLRRLAQAAVALFPLVVLPANGQVINEDVQLTASDGELEDQFGQSIDIDNGVIAVGAPRHNDNSFGSGYGSAYLFDAATGTQLFELIPSDGAEHDLFGVSIAIDNGIVAVGAQLDDDNGINSGSVYLFDATTGAQIFKLLPSDGAANDRFGKSIAIDNGIVAIGAPAHGNNGSGSGAVYLFNASTGAQIFKLLPDDSEAGDVFGNPIAISKGVVAVGVLEDDDNGKTSGAAYTFWTSTGEQIAKFHPNDGEAHDAFGFSIAIDNGIVAVGAVGDGEASGSAYLFDAFTGGQIQKLLPSDGEVNDLFGYSIAIDNGIVAVGAAFDRDNGINSGSAYFFGTSGGQFAKLLSSIGVIDENFGWSIAIDNGVIAVGSNNSGFNTHPDTAYIFRTTPATCPADLTGDGELNFFDVSAFLAALGAQDPSADFTGDGEFNFFDVSAFLQAFATGCP